MEGLGNRIKLARGTLSQRELAAKLDVHRSTLGAWEIDRREPDIAALANLAKVLGVSLDWLVGIDNTPTIEHARAYHDPKWHEIIDLALAHNIKPEKAKQLIKVALTLKS